MRLRRKAIKYYLTLSDEFVLELIVSEKDWAQVFLCNNAKSELLGAESFSSITKKICSAFGNIDEYEIIGEIDNISVINVLNLSSPHTSFYLSKGHQETHLFLQNGTTLKSTRITLDEKLCANISDAYKTGITTTLLSTNKPKGNFSYANA